MIGASARPGKKGMRYVARSWAEAQFISLGTFDTAERASIAYRLFEYWRKAGFAIDAIPTINRTKDAI